jgi:hypothetical protein
MKDDDLKDNGKTGCLSKHDQNQCQIKINFNSIECETITNSISESGYQGRKHLLTEFSNILNEKIQKFGIYCTLRSLSNWFKVENSRKKKCSDWSGLYQCINAGCKIKYTAKIDIFDRDIQLELNWPRDSIYCEKILPKTERCSGEKRKALALRLVSNGISNTRNDIINYNGILKILNY